MLRKSFRSWGSLPRLPLAASVAPPKSPPKRPAQWGPQKPQTHGRVPQSPCGHSGFTREKGLNAPSLIYDTRSGLIGCLGSGGRGSVWLWQDNWLECQPRRVIFGPWPTSAPNHRLTKPWRQRRSPNGRAKAVLQAIQSKVSTLSTMKTEDWRSKSISASLKIDAVLRLWRRRWSRYWGRAPTQ